jgi:hypothetical protein
MIRFDRQDTEASNLPAPLDIATGELESFIERQVREIIDAAVEKAGQIERDAADRARDVEHEAAEWAQAVKRQAEHRAQEMFEEAFKRAWRMLDGIDLLESGVGDLIGALRAEMEGFAADLGSATPTEGNAPSQLGEAAPAAEAVDPFEQKNHSHAEVEQMIVEQVAAMFRAGRSRGDAERLVMRFKQGEDYLHVLDRIYAGEGGGEASTASTPDRNRWGFRPEGS